MNLVVRPALPSDDCCELLFASARPYYTAYFGSEETAVQLLKSVWPKLGHAASYEFCHVALDEGQPVGVMSGFPVSDGDRLSRRFIAMTVLRMAWRLPAITRHLRAAGDVAPRPPVDAYYVDALAVDPAYQRRGIARRLLGVAESQARRFGLDRVALDTGLQNASARALYGSYGFREREIRRAPDDRTAQALGGPGFVGYLKDIQ